MGTCHHAFITPRKHIMTKLRATFCIESILNRTGGAERVLIDVANGLARRGHDITILHHEPPNGTMPYPVVDTIKVVNLFRPQPRILHRVLQRIKRDEHVPASWRWSLQYTSFVKRLRHHLHHHPADAVIAFLPPAMEAVAKATHGLPLRTLASVHSSPAFDYESPKNWGFGDYGMRKRAAVLHHFSSVGVLLDTFKPWYNAHGVTNVAIIPNAIKPCAAQNLTSSAQRSTILSVGRLSEVKRHHLLLEAWASLHDRYPQWDLHIYGEGPLMADLHKQAIDANLDPTRIFKGVSNTMEAVYPTAAILAHPSLHEGFPLVVGEALAAGLPCVAFASCTGANTLVTHHHNGLLVDDDAPAKRLAQGLAALMDDPAQRGKLGDQGPASVAQYTPESILDLWESWIANAPHRPTHQEVML